MKILAIHPGQTFSTCDVYNGLCAGLEANGVEVVRFNWTNMLQLLGGLVIGAVAGGILDRKKASTTQAFASWLAAADSIGVALDREVDAAIVVNGLLFPPERASLLQRLKIPVACYGTEAPYTTDTELQFAPYYTHWFTQERSAVEQFRDVMPGRRAFYLPMAYSPEMHAPGPKDPHKACDVVFVGGGFPERQELLFGTAQPETRAAAFVRRLLRRPPPVLGGVDWSGIEYVIKGTLWHLDLEAERGNFGPERMVRYAEHATTNDITAEWHRSATIALNIHRQMTRVETPDRTIPPGTAESLGPRAYEIPAVGGFMLCDDDRPELFDVFGDSAATFRAWDSADLERQIRYWLAHPDQREATARAQYEAVQPHTWANRARFVLETITS